VQDAADHSPIVLALLAAHVRRQLRFDLPPLLVTQPKQVAAHRLCSLTAENQQPILTATALLSFDPSAEAGRARILGQ
jgi:hypothetical protein